MFKKTVALLALTGALAVLAPNAALAADEVASRPIATAEQDGGKVDPAVDQAFTDIEQRLAGDPALLKELQAAAARGDTAGASKLLATDGAEVLSITADDSAETTNLVIRVRVTVCVVVFGQVYCRTITVTVVID